LAAGDKRSETRFGSWVRGTKPTDVLSVVMALLSVVVAALALHKADQVAQQQEEASAPVLAPGTPLSDRGKRVWVNTEYAKVSKRLDRMFLDRSAPALGANGRMIHVGRIVLPLRNGGVGVALTVGRPVLVQDCDRQPRYLPATAVGLLGTYLLPTNGSDQLGYLQRPTDKGGSINLDGTSYWYSFDYRHFGEIGATRPTNLVIWYTDGARRLLRWTCISYSYDPANSHGQQTEWAVAAQEYGTRPFVGGGTQAP